ncbi:MAG: TetR/AcrR family transcriptional regulator [Jatrophihabitans sp.]|uniref:TetR/AcrR family transcriptional regulator n=1 Tax=Jatrophihabitans sp. TaxID=1932789 RepID=UPI003F81C71B
MSTPAGGTKGVPRAEREQQIVRVAIDEFARAGYAGASVAVIARRAGISKPLVYQYFGSKDGLYSACLHSVADGLLTRLESAERSVDDSVASRIYTLQAVFEALEPQRAAWQLLYDPSMPTDGPIAAAAADYRERTLAIAASGSARFLRARGIRSRLDASALTAIWMGIVSAAVAWWLEHPGESASEMTARCERLIGAVLT